MAIGENKERKYVSLKKTTIKYLHQRVVEEQKIRKRNVTISELLDELAENDQKIRKAFSN